MFQLPLQPLIFQLIIPINNIFLDDPWKFGFLFMEIPKSGTFGITPGLYLRVDLQLSGYDI